MWRYYLIILITMPLIVLYTLFRAIKFKDFRYFLQRIGLSNFKNNSQNKPIWIHAASVGEVYASLPLINEILANHATQSIQITTNTATAANIVALEFPKNIQHFYMPIDWRWAINKIITATQAQCIFIIETEIWPNLYQLATKKNIPIIIINARLSHRTLSSFSWLLTIYQSVIQLPKQILTRSNEDSLNYIKLGANKSQIKEIGNIKYSSLDLQKIKRIDLQHPYVLAASTHSDEELQLVSLWSKLIEQSIISNEILVIVPRHPERGNSIEQQLKKIKLNIAVRSKGQKVVQHTQIYIADTIGELKSFMINAKFIFIGGSLIAHGGQNIIEPAQLQKAIIFGPYMYNFKTESQKLLDNNAAIQVKDSNELFDIFKKLISQKDQIELLENAVSTLMAKENAIAQNYYNEIKKYIND